MSNDIRQMIDKVKNWKPLLTEKYNYSYYDNPNPKETFNPEYYLLTKLDGEGYSGNYDEFKESEEYQSYIETIQLVINKIKSLKYPLRIYRGIKHIDKNYSVYDFLKHEDGNISWTYDLSVAKLFGDLIFTGIVEYNDVNIQATINRNVLHHTLNESEIVLKDNNLIKDLKQLK